MYYFGSYGVLYITSALFYNRCEHETLYGHRSSSLRQFFSYEKVARDASMRNVHMHSTTLCSVFKVSTPPLSYTRVVPVLSHDKEEGDAHSNLDRTITILHIG